MDDFTLFKIGTDMLMKKDVSQWPKVDVVMFKRSSNMPMSKVEEFCKIHRPLLINDIATQHTILSDRRLVYKTLQRAGVRIVLVFERETREFSSHLFNVSNINV
jgi:hypothetical protein